MEPQLHEGGNMEDVDWKAKYAEFENENALKNACSRHGARNVAQIRDMLGRKVVFAEMPNGECASVIELEGKMVSVDEVVGRLATAPEHTNLFRHKSESKAVAVPAPVPAGESLHQRIGRCLKSPIAARPRGAIDAGSPTDSPIKKIARGLRTL
jgi:hypothetical protein